MEAPRQANPGPRRPPQRRRGHADAQATAHRTEPPSKAPGSGLRTRNPRTPISGCRRADQRSVIRRAGSAASESSAWPRGRSGHATRPDRPRPLDPGSALRNPGIPPFPTRRSDERSEIRRAGATAGRKTRHMSGIDRQTHRAPPKPSDFAPLIRPTGASSRSGVAWRGVAWRGVAWRGVGGGGRGGGGPWGGGGPAGGGGPPPPPPPPHGNTAHHTATQAEAGDPGADARAGGGRDQSPRCPGSGAGRGSLLDRGGGLAGP